MSKRVIKSMNVFKITSGKMMSANNTRWGENVSHQIIHPQAGKGGLCSGNWLHCYQDMRQALLFNHQHANFSNPVYWTALAEGEFCIENHNFKMGCTRLTTLKRVYPTMKRDKVMDVVIALIYYASRNGGWFKIPEAFHNWATGVSQHPEDIETNKDLARKAMRAVNKMTGVYSASLAMTAVLITYTAKRKDKTFYEAMGSAMLNTLSFIRNHGEKGFDLMYFMDKQGLEVEYL